MGPKSIIIGKRRDNGKIELISDLNASVSSVEASFMPFRLNRENPTYEWTCLSPLGDPRLERHTIPASVPEQPKGKSSMKSLKSALSIIAFLALAFTAPSTQAQSLNYKSILGDTANSPASTDNTTFYTTNSTTYVARGNQLGIQVDFKLQGAGSSAVVFRFDSSLDGINWTASSILMTNTASATTLVTKTQTFDVGGVPYFRLTSINNGNATAVTNLAVKFVSKTN